MTKTQNRLENELVKGLTNFLSKVALYHNSDL